MLTTPLQVLLTFNLYIVSANAFSHYHIILYYCIIQYRDLYYIFICNTKSEKIISEKLLIKEKVKLEER